MNNERSFTQQTGEDAVYYHDGSTARASCWCHESGGLVSIDRAGLLLGLVQLVQR